jgi:peptide/nickel transport system ATP-binding protein
MEETSVVLKVRDLAVEFETEQGKIRAVDRVGFDLEKGKILGIAGESGCGKSVTALSLIRLLPKPVSNIVNGSVWFSGQDILKQPVSDMHHIRGRRISMIFQEPMTALNPVRNIGSQMTEVYRLHFPQMSAGQMDNAAADMLEKVGIPDRQNVLKRYPHQLSGGMRQRVMIAMALACEPDILIADEPTTALDVTVQAQILALIKTLREKLGMAVILITHDLGVIAQNCDDVVVMYAGRVAERAPVQSLFRYPRHPYTQGLLQSIPSLSKQAKTRLPTIAGSVPPLSRMPDGCRFAGRCPRTEDRCLNTVPGERQMGDAHMAACHFAQP